jgi:hypothetical protein
VPGKPVIIRDGFTVVLIENRRAKRPLGAAWAVYLDQAFRASMAGAGLWLDTSDQTPDETVDSILRLLHLGSPA